MKNPINQEKVNKFFNQMEKPISLFSVVERMISGIGPVTVTIKKSQISFGTKRKFAWVWLPRPWDRRPENSIVLTFGLARQLEDKQIVQAVEPYPGRWTHHVIIREECDLNENVRGWLCEAYHSSQKKVHHLSSLGRDHQTRGNGKK